MTKEILITGGCGYVGTALIKSLLENKFRIKVIDIQWYGNYLEKHKNLKILKKDIRDITAQDIKNVDTIIHLASISNDPSSEVNPKLSWEVGPLATLKLLSFAKEAKVKKFIYASSGSVYGVSKKKQVSEETALLPLSDYNKQKMVTEKIVENFSNFFKTIILRPATICGNSKRLRLDLTVNLLTYQSYKNNLITVFGGNQIRPNLHIDDMISCYIFCIKNNIQGIYNVGFENLSVLDIAKLIQKKTNCKIKVTKSNDPRSYRLNSSKILKVGYRNNKNVCNAIDELLEFFNKSKFNISKKNINLEVIKKLKIK